MFKILRGHLRYRLDNLFSYGSAVQFALVIVLALAALAFGMTAYFLGLFSPENAAIEGIARKHDDGGFFDTLWWSIRLLFDPTAFYGIQGATWPILLIALVMTVLGMTVFATLIGFISSAIDARLAYLRKGHSSVFESGHILILGWNNMAASILEFISQSRSNAKVVILAPREIEEMQETLRVAGIYDRKIKVILRSGAPSNLVELQRVTFKAASSIIVLAHTDVTHADADPDIEVIKTLMLLSSFDGWKGAPPKIVGEIIQKEKLEIARIAGGHRIPIVSSSQIVSKVAVQCSRQANLSAVYAQLFSFEGSAIHIMPFPESAGMRFGEALHAFPNAVLLGISRRQQLDGHWHYLPELNPGDGHLIGADESLILLCTGSSVSYRVLAHLPSLAASIPAAHQTVPLERILILGWNSNIYDVLAEYNEYVRDGTTIDVVSDLDESAARARLAAFGASDFANLRLGFRKANTILRSALETIDPTSYNCIVVLADASHNEADPDARTIMALILLKDILAAVAPDARPQMVGEILNSSNRDLVARTGVTDIVVSPEIVSMLLTQVSQQQMLISVYDVLLSSGGVEIYLKPATRYVAAGTTVSFGQLTALVQRQQEIALGVLIDDGHETKEILLNPAKRQSWLLGENDRVIVLAQDLYADAGPSLHCDRVDLAVGEPSPGSRPTAPLSITP
jgi:hypothetical protein